MSSLINSFAYKGLLMQGSAAMKASLLTKGGGGAFLVSSLACNTMTARADAVESADDVLQACVATLSDRGTAWDLFFQPIISAFYPAEIAKVFCWNLLLHCSITFNQYMAELMSHEQAAIEAEAEGFEAPPPPPMPDFKPSIDRAKWGSIRDLCKKAVMRFYQGLVILRVGFSKAQALIRNPNPWLRDHLLPKLRNAPKLEVVKQVFSFMMHTQALYLAAEFTVSVVISTKKILQIADATVKAKGLKIVRAVIAQLVRCNILYVTTSLGGALCTCIYPAVLGLTSGSMLSDLAISLVISPLIQLIAG